MGAAQPGRGALVKYGSQTSPETYSTLGGLRNVDLQIDASPVDSTTKDSGGAQEMLPSAGVTKYDVTAQGLFKSGTASLASMVAASNIPQSLIALQIIFNNGDTYTGMWAIRTLKRTGTYQDAETYDFSVTSSGQIAFTAGT